MKNLKFLILSACCVCGVASAEDFISGNDLAHIRYLMTASELSDGKILISGGATAVRAGGCPGTSAAIPDAEIYDPITQNFSLIGPMISGRYEHSEVVMLDGRVLLMGGVTDCINDETNSTEIYDPSTEEFVSSSPMTIPRYGFPAAIKANGNVLVFGGIKEGNFATATQRVDEYDISLGTWATVGNISEPKGYMTGCDLGDERMLLIGGINYFNDQNPSRAKSAEIYDFATNTSRKLGIEPIFLRTRWGKAVRLLDGRCLIAGANSSSGIELFDPATETFSAVALPSGFSDMGMRQFIPAMLSNGKVLLVSDEPLLFDPETDQLNAIATNANLPNFGHIAIATQNNTVLIAGGRYADGNGTSFFDKTTFLYSSNNPPTADAGSDQAIRAGDLVALDGSASYDDNTATIDLTYAWTFASLPVGSAASLTGADTATPSFTADVAGTYLLELIVADTDGAVSAPDYVEVSSNNLAPTALINASSLVIVGETVTLDGTASSDPEGDALQFNWSIDAAPVGSSATMASNVMAQTSFVPDVPGDYEIGLSVSDFIGAGSPDSTVINAATAEDYVQIVVQETYEEIQGLPEDAFHSGGNQNSLSNFLLQANQLVQDGDIAGAINKLEDAISRTDGCALRGSPDGNGTGRDWIDDCSAQAVAYTELTDALAVLQAI